MFSSTPLVSLKFTYRHKAHRGHLVLNGTHEPRTHKHLGGDIWYGDTWASDTVIVDLKVILGLDPTLQGLLKFILVKTYKDLKI